MRVKIGKKWFDSKAVPICVELSPSDKINISGMQNDCFKYACFPKGHESTASEKADWMDYEKQVIKKPVLNRTQQTRLRQLAADPFYFRWSTNKKGDVCFHFARESKFDRACLYLTLSMRSLVNRGFVGLYNTGFCYLTEAAIKYLEIKKGQGYNCIGSSKIKGF